MIEQPPIFKALRAICIIVIILIGGLILYDKIQKEQISSIAKTGTVYCEKDIDCSCNCCQRDIKEDPFCGLYPTNAPVDLPMCVFTLCPRAGETSQYIKCINNRCIWVKKVK